MKGQAEVTEILTTVGIIVVLIVMIPIIIPKIKEAIESSAMDSSDVVSRDLASLISITVASPSDISIDYTTPSGKTYDVDIEDRMVTVSGNSEENKKEVSTPILIDAKGSFSNLDDFKIEKRIDGILVKYYINNEVIFQTTVG